MLKLAAIEQVAGMAEGRFAEDYLAPRKPVVLSGFASHWPALAKWTPEFLAREHGHHRVDVFDASFGDPGRRYMRSVRRMRFDEYLECVLNRDMDLRMFLYNIAARIPALRADVPPPELVPGFSNRFIFAFFGCRGSVTQNHFDIDMSHVFHTVIRGRKRVTLFDPAQGHGLHRHPFTVRSYADIDDPDLARFPRLPGVSGMEVVLEAGQTLFIPAGFWHHVRYEEGGYGVSHRVANERVLGRLHGYANLLVLSPIDRVLNTLLGRHWFSVKARLAGERVGVTGSAS